MNTTHNTETTMTDDALTDRLIVKWSAEPAMVYAGEEIAGDIVTTDDPPPKKIDQLAAALRELAQEDAGRPEALIAADDIPNVDWCHVGAHFFAIEHAFRGLQ